MPSTLLTFPPLSAELASIATPARYARRNSHRLVQFAESVDSEAIYTNQLPEAYQGAGLTILLPWVAESATSGDAYWGISFERLDQAGVDIDDAPTWGTEILVASTAPGISGQIQNALFTFSDAQIDGLQSGENFRIRVRRLGTNVLDTMSGGAQVMTLRISQNAIAGVLTVREQDNDPNVAGVNEIIVDNTKLTDNTGGSVTLDLSGGGGGGGGFFSDGAGTNAGIGKGTVAPLAGGENSLAQGDGSTAPGDNSFAFGRDITLHGDNQLTAFGRNITTLNCDNSQFFGQSITQVSHLGYGPWFIAGETITEDFQFTKAFGTYSGTYYVYQSGGVIFGPQNTVSWRGYLYAPTAYAYEQYYYGWANVIGGYNTVYSGGSNVFGFRNQLGANQTDMNAVCNFVAGSNNDIDGSFGSTFGVSHTVNAGLEFFSTHGRDSVISMSSEHRRTTRLASENNYGYTFEVAGMVRTTSTSKTDILKLEIPINTTYAIKCMVVAKLGANGFSGGVAALPTGAADIDGRMAMVERDNTTGIRLRNNTTTDATITFDNIVLDGIAVPTITLEITTTSVTVRVTPGAATNTIWHAKIEAVEI